MYNILAAQYLFGPLIIAANVVVDMLKYATGIVKLDFSDNALDNSSVEHLCNGAKQLRFLEVIVKFSMKKGLKRFFDTSLLLSVRLLRF